MARKILLLLSVLLLCFGALELYFQDKSPPRIQQIKTFDNHSLRLIDGVPVWHSKNPERELVANRDCIETTNGQSDVALLGDSIFFGVGVHPSLTLAHRLQKHLSERLARPSCVVNLSEPGFAFMNQEAVFREAVGQIKPRVLVLEMWFNSINRFVAVDNAAYNFGSLSTDKHGFPNLGIPADMNRILFQRFATWRHVSTGLVKKHPKRISELWADFVVEKLEPFAASLDSQNIQLVLAFATQLHAPFAEGRPQEDEAYQSVKEWATARDIPQLFFSEELANEAVESVRLDTCCHLNARGTQVIADSLAPKLVQILEPGVE